MKEFWRKVLDFLSGNWDRKVSEDYEAVVRSLDICHDEFVVVVDELMLERATIRALEDLEARTWDRAIQEIVDTTSLLSLSPGGAQLVQSIVAHLRMVKDNYPMVNDAINEVRDERDQVRGSDGGPGQLRGQGEDR